jgi:hypothetical protein
MKIHLKFKEEDKPLQMGLNQIFNSEELDKFLLDRSEILVGYTIFEDRSQINFTKEDGSIGVAYLTEVPDDFKLN